MQARNDSEIPSIFDKQHKLEDPSAEFDWECPPPSYHVNLENIICEGQLQEIDPSNSQLHSERHYVATVNEILRFSVFHISIYIS